VSEAEKLRWTDLSIEVRTAVLHGPKTAKRPDGIQFLHLSQEALDIILAQPRESQYVFFNPETGSRWWNLNKGFSAAAIRVGLVWDDGPLRIHDLRHYFITTSLHAGIPDAVVENMARIDDVRTLRRYTKKKKVAIEEGFAMRREYLKRAAGAAQHG
jgi:integrase